MKSLWEQNFDPEHEKNMMYVFLSSYWERFFGMQCKSTISRYVLSVSDSAYTFCQTSISIQAPQSILASKTISFCATVFFVTIVHLNNTFTW